MAPRDEQWQEEATWGRRLLLKSRNQKDPEITTHSHPSAGVQRTASPNMATCPQRPSPQLEDMRGLRCPHSLDPRVGQVERRGAWRGGKGILRVVSRREHWVLEPAVEAQVFQVFCLLTRRVRVGDHEGEIRDQVSLVQPLRWSEADELSVGSRARSGPDMAPPPPWLGV